MSNTSLLTRFIFLPCAKRNPHCAVEPAPANFRHFKPFLFHGYLCDGTSLGDPSSQAVPRQKGTSKAIAGRQEKYL
jgi:hypothetical protein